MKSAVLLIDLQRDFLAGPGARLPVSAEGAEQVLQVANEILAGSSLRGALPIVVVNEFPRDATIMNLLRRRAAIAGSAGAELDPRLADASHAKKIPKSRASAFTNPELDEFLRSEGIDHLYVLGVMAEGCVRATVLDARRRNYRVSLIANAIASNADWKLRLALWWMKRAGAEIARLTGPDRRPVAH
jgi:nicotinamidase-related amidase